MYSKKIDKHTFELEEEIGKIMIYREGEGVEPISYISIKSGLTEKEFDYEIMWWFSNNK